MGRNISRRRAVETLTAASLSYSTPAIFRCSSSLANTSVLPTFADGQALIIGETDASAASISRSFNLRTSEIPKIRVLCQTPQAIAELIRWSRSNGIGFAVRGGGHCFENFSQNKSLVIDLRYMNGVEVDPSTRTARIQGGATLGDVYRAIGGHGLALSAGFCLTVGVGGHLLGGGVGFLSRTKGLACDALRSVRLVDAAGNIVRASRVENSDLFWACLGGGGGSFGVVVEFDVDLFPLPKIDVFEVDWVVPLGQAVTLLQLWQDWAPSAPRTIGAILNVSRHRDDKFLIQCWGQSIGLEQHLKEGILGLTKKIPAHSAPRIRSGSFWAGANVFSRPSDTGYGYYKYRSDFISEPIGADGWRNFFEAMGQHGIGAVKVMLQAYGGALADVGKADTAFPHRAGTLIGLEYGTQIRISSQTKSHLNALDAVYQAMRPYVTGGAYCNYPDLDLVDWGHAYWGHNFSKLREIKTKYDPGNVFRHAQSVPPL